VAGGALGDSRLSVSAFMSSVGAPCLEVEFSRDV
jgi:hypothetical protein